MALFPLRNLGQYGVNTDVDSLDLPISVFSQANNVRFIDGHIAPGPVFAKLGQSTSNTAPRWCYSYQLQGQTAVYLVMNQNGTVASVAANNTSSPLTWTNLSVSAYSPSTTSTPFTATMLSNVVYVNREDRVPWSMTPSASQFSNLANWDSTWRCKALRSFNGCLVAINVTKGATAYPTMVKTSDFAAFATVPGTWTGATTNSATENVLSDLTDSLVDGFTLRDRFMLYSTNKTWYMQPNGGTTVYDYKPLFSNYGVISQNCIAEVNNQHFVFGDADLWAHDGYTPRSIATGKVRNFVFNNLIKAQSYQFFVWSNPRLNEIMFCYVSNDPFCAFPVNDTIGYPGCNRAAVYNWMYDTWTFYDLPYIVGGGLGVMYSGGSGLTYDIATQTYETVSGSYQGIGDFNRLYSLAVGRGGSITTPILPLQSTGSWDAATHLYSFELLESVVGVGQIVPATNAPIFLENELMDMDEVTKELRGYKIVTAVYPEGRIDNPSNPLTFWFGSVDYSGQTITYDHPMTFDGDVNYKMDFNQPGRYLSMRIAMANPRQKFILSGLDLEVKVTGHR